MCRILFVDDETAILRSLKRLFNGLDWELFFAENGKEALQILSEHEIDMVISDMRMPNMDGHALLKEVQRLYPHTIRLILSGFSDEKEIYQAVLDGSAKSYLLKPWEPKQLMDYLGGIFELRNLLISRKVFNYIENIKSIPTFEGVVNEIGTLLERDAGTAEIARVIERDPGISARILQLVNSSSYNKNISSVKQAAYQIGNQVLKKIITDGNYTRCIAENSEEGRKYGFISSHAAATYRIMDITYRNFLAKETPEIAITASSLHNIGIFIALNSDDRELAHDEVGGYLLKWWGIPNALVESAFYHHNPFHAPAENRELIEVIHLANYYASELLNISFGALNEKVFDALNINRQAYEKQIGGL